MSYTTPSEVRLAASPDVVDGTSQPETPTNSAADLTDAQLADAITEAQTVVDGYLGALYTVPVEEAVEPLPMWTRTIALYLATMTYRRSQDLSDNDPVVRRYRLVLDQLIAASKGTITLSLPTATVGSSAAGVPASPYQGSLFQPDDFGLGLFPDCPPRRTWWPGR